ncbi:hypothetical protein HMPREF9387_0661 [Streptococcus sanguinis SK340]|nr:hypothetical protein HMPREF9387_0661 [Streptococcus sanguinis SK340]
MIKAKIDLICLFFRKQTVFQFHFQCFTTDEILGRKQQVSKKSGQNLYSTLISLFKLILVNFCFSF